MNPTPGRVLAPLEPLPDEEIVRRVRSGERDLFELLLRRHNQRVYRAVRAVIRDEVEVEDVMQQSYVLAFQHLGQFAGAARFSTWLVRIAINEAFGRVRQARRLVLVDVDDSDDAEAPMNRAAQEMMTTRTPEQLAETREIVALVERIVDALPEKYRTVLILREIEGLSTAEVSNVLGTSEDVVKTRLHRARALLQQEVDVADGSAMARAFPFEARRCDRVVGAVMLRIALG
jgi:RNA polymerase sigma-70 factor (ECF subfamily)